MESQFIGVVRNAETKQILMVINPDADSELDNPRWLLLKEENKTVALELIKVPRGEYMGALTMDQLGTLISKLEP
jgi:hypothetical protein